MWVDRFEQHLKLYQLLALNSFKSGVSLIQSTSLSGGNIVTCGNDWSALIASQLRLTQKNVT